MLGRGWGSPTDWSRINPRNNRKDRPDQAKDASGTGSTKELRRSEAKADGVRSWRQSYAQGLTLERSRTVRLELPQELSRVHHTFHVSNLKKCYADEPLVMPLEGIHVDDKLQFVEEPVEIMEREIKRLKRSRIPLVKVRWNSRRGPEFTWEREDSFKQKYPQLFTNRASSSTTRAKRRSPKKKQATFCGQEFADQKEATTLVTCQAVATRRQLYVWKNEKIEDIVKPNPSILVKALKEQLQKKYQVGISIELQRTNEDTTMKIDLEKDYNLKGLRDLLGLDGCFIKGQYAGQLLTSVGIDANHGIYPGILLAIAQVFPNAEHRFYVRHIYENFKAQQKDNQFRELVWKCAAATTVPYFDKQIGKLKNLDEGRAHCDVLLNYLCEVFNRQLLDGRDVPIITCLEFVRDYLMKRIVNVKKVISKSLGPLTPAAIKLFEAIKYKATFYKVRIQVVDMKINGVGMETMKGVNSRGGRGYGNYQDRGDYGNYQEGGEYKNYQGYIIPRAADHVSYGAWMLYYYQRSVTIFEQYSISAGACEFALAALEQVDIVLGLGIIFRSNTIFTSQEFSQAGSSFTTISHAKEARCIAEKSIIVADMEERVNRAVILANQMAKCLARGAERWCSLKPHNQMMISKRDGREVGKIALFERNELKGFCSSLHTFSCRCLKYRKFAEASVEPVKTFETPKQHNPCRPMFCEFLKWLEILSSHQEKAFENPVSVSTILRHLTKTASTFCLYLFAAANHAFLKLYVAVDNEGRVDLDIEAD
ncbi:hypothetical protein Tco_0860893 [Tanacetum coccineum]|uniref:Reverse transcriptase domain-containing protein n=1 Tax=Tanacetum coccineum TaxID=301880 RepID=A0ABQ5BG85_9ASTR